MYDRCRGKSLLNGIKQQIFIPHLFWSRCCYYYKSGYHSLVSNSAKDFHNFSKTGSVFVPWSQRSSIIWLQANFFSLISCLFPLYSPQTVTQALSTMGTLLYFLCLEFVFIPAFTSMSFFFLSFKSQLKCYILREFSVDESIKYLSSSDVLFNIIGYIAVKTLHSIHVVSLCIYY